MKKSISEQINNPHFYEDNAYDNVFTFEDLMNQCLGGADKPKEAPKMHLWLPFPRTQEQIEFVKKLCGIKQDLI